MNEEIKPMNYTKYCKNPKIIPTTTWEAQLLGHLIRAGFAKFKYPDKNNYPDDFPREVVIDWQKINQNFKYLGIYHLIGEKSKSIIRGWLSKAVEEGLLNSELEGDNVNPEPKDLQLSNWAIVELMGHKVVAGLAGKSELFGDAMLRIDVPATSEYPAFTQMYGTAAIYAITFVSEEVARATAEYAAVNPVSVYVPELVTREEYNEEVRRLEDRIRALQDRLNRPELPEGSEDAVQDLEDELEDIGDEDDDFTEPF